MSDTFAASLVDAERDREHAADFERTRITPGADPRAHCEPFNWRAMQHLLVSRPRAIAEIERSGMVGDRCCVVMDNPRAKVARVVPEDVARWRDPIIRAELKRRARAHAAIKPGVHR